jgi:hypothetical protein
MYALSDADIMDVDPIDRDEAIKCRRQTRKIVS